VLCVWPLFSKEEQRVRVGRLHGHSRPRPWSSAKRARDAVAAALSRVNEEAGGDVAMAKTAREMRAAIKQRMATDTAGITHTRVFEAMQAEPSLNRPSDASRARAAESGRVTPHLGSFCSLCRHFSRFRKI
jgi:hypothetical protein